MMIVKFIIGSYLCGFFGISIPNRPILVCLQVSVCRNAVYIKSTQYTLSKNQDKTQT